MVLQKNNAKAITLKNNQNFHKVFYLFVAVMITAGVARSVFSLAAFAVLLVYVLMANKKNVYLALFFIMPFASIFKMSPSSTSLFTYIMLVAFAKLFLGSKRIDGKFFVSWIIFSLYLLLGSQLNLQVLIKQAIILPLMYFFFYEEKLDIKGFTLHYANGLLLSSFIAQFNNLIPNMSKYIINDVTFELEENVTRFSGFYSDPNYYTLAILLALSCILVLYANKKIGAEVYIYYILIAVFGSQTVSKSFILLFGFLSAFFVFILLKNRNYKALLVYFIFLMVGLYFIFSGRLTFFDNIVDRLTLGNRGDITTGRLDIWQNYFDYFSQNTDKLLFGSGIGVDYLMTAPHNTYIDFLYFYGFVGTILFLFIIALIIIKNKQSKKNIMNFFPIIGLAINYIFLISLMFYDLFFSISLAILFLTYDFNDEKINRLKS